MKKRPIGFLGVREIDHDGEIFDYIKELHEYLWNFVRLRLPYVSGTLDFFIDEALDIAESKNCG